ncbi:MAG: M23 family metallopeptidase [Caulobacteraceae bacterium]
MSRGTPSGLGLVAAALAAPALLLALPLAGHGGRAADTPRPIVPARPTPPPSRSISVAMRARESLPAALVRGGVDGGEARRAAIALGEDFDIVNPHPGLILDLAVAAPADAPSRLLRLSFKTVDGRRVTERRGPGGTFRVTDAPAAMVVAALRRVDGRVDGSLYLSLVDAGVEAPLAARVVDLFGRRLDLSRDVESGDRFSLVFEGRGTADGAMAVNTLLYAEVVGRAGPSRLYRFQPDGVGRADYLDGEAGPSRPLLLRTPVAGARITSSFGLRPHPILGFTRMHQGVDFGASPGAPVLAAGDGVVEEARWAGGYGRWLKIRHAAGFETAYAHLSGWAAGVAPGARVRQGEVVGYVGATGLATGPHLHFEVFSGGRRIDPALAGAARAQAANPARLAMFRAAKARIDAIVATAG